MKKYRDIWLSVQAKALSISRQLKLAEISRELQIEATDLARWLKLPEISQAILSELLSIARWLKLAEICRVVKYRILSILRRFNIRSTLAIAGILGPIIVTTGDLTAALNTEGYNLVSDSISSLALTRIGWLQTIGFLALGLLVEVFTAGLLFNIKRGRWFHLGIGVLVFFGFGMLLIGAFNTDAVGAARTIEGRIHGLAASTDFSLFAVAVLALSASLKQDPDWQPLYRYSLVTCALAVLLGVALRFFKDGSSLFGLVERVLVANMIIWVEVAAINLLRLSLKRGERLDNEAEIG